MMKQIPVLFFLAFATALSAQKTELMPIKVDTGYGLINYDKIAPQEPSRMGQQQGGKGLIALLVANGVSGVKRMIDNRKKKYFSEYGFAIQNEQFYSNISTSGVFDPTGIIFKGFTIARIYKNNGVLDTAFVAKFVLDTTADKLLELLNSSMFSLRLESLRIKSPRVKMPENDRRVNMDFDIRFYSSYINAARDEGSGGEIIRDQLVGKFIYTVRDAPVDTANPGYAAYYASLQNEQCLGKSFIIPRSKGIYKKNANVFQHCYGPGIFSVVVSVKESAESNFVDKIINWAGDDLMSLGNEKLVRKYGYAPSPVR
jgi:hypothetical protein